MNKFIVTPNKTVKEIIAKRELRKYLDSGVMQPGEYKACILNHCFMCEGSFPHSANDCRRGLGITRDSLL